MPNRCRRTAKKAKMREGGVEIFHLAWNMDKTWKNLIRIRSKFETEPFLTLLLHWETLQEGTKLFEMLAEIVEINIVESPKKMKIFIGSFTTLYDQKNVAYKHFSPCFLGRKSHLFPLPMLRLFSVLHLFCFLLGRERKPKKFTKKSVFNLPTFVRFRLNLENLEPEKKRNHGMQKVKMFMGRNSQLSQLGRVCKENRRGSKVSSSLTLQNFKRDIFKCEKNPNIFVQVRQFFQTSSKAKINPLLSVKNFSFLCHSDKNKRSSLPFSLFLQLVQKSVS